jgi:S-adenosylmethionine decarboxylase proenzyme
MKGREVRADLVGIDEERLMNGEALCDVCAEAARLAGATVVRKAWANLGDGDGTPPGCTVAVLLNESHITLHTYAKEGLAAINVFTCGERAKPDVALKYIRTALQAKMMMYDSQERFADLNDSGES